MVRGVWRGVEEVKVHEAGGREEHVKTHVSFNGETCGMEEGGNEAGHDEDRDVCNGQEVAGGRGKL